MVIIRAHSLDQRAATAEALLPIARERHQRLLIANDPDLAQRIVAHGVHFSEAHTREALHWRALRPDWIITVAAHSLAACASAKRRGANAALLSPVFPTQSHRGDVYLGVRALLIARQAPLPVYALGGIDAETAARLRDSRFVGLAAIGALRI
jgi:thiamine-phosphate pyrophosphorylase